MSELLLQRAGNDVSRFKRAALVRAVQARMRARGVSLAEDYVEYLRNRVDEPLLLARQLLVGVTSFFRNAEAFEALRGVLVSRLGESAGEESYRIWIAGCSSGQEAYSVAMLARECLDATGRERGLKVFATDLDALSIERARLGRYPDSIASEVGLERLARFFTRCSGGYKVRRELRASVLFSVCDVLQDPPFASLDLVCCRNLLVYLHDEAQRRVLDKLFYALKPGGLLFLGASSGFIGTASSFVAVVPKWKIFERRARSARRAADGGFNQPTNEIAERTPRLRSIGHVARDALLRSHCPAAVVTDATGTVLQQFGRVGKYLQPATGQSCANVVVMALGRLDADLADALRQVDARRRRVALRKVRAGAESITVTLQPIGGARRNQGLVLISFQDEGPARRRGAGVGPVDRRFRLLQERYALAIEELQCAREERQGAAEESRLLSGELDTLRAEVQSLRAELAATNAELQRKIDELGGQRHDACDMLSGAGVSGVLVDANLVIRRMTPEAERTLRLCQGDIGRPMWHLTELADLAEDTRQVVAGGAMVERMAGPDGAQRYAVKIIPHRASSDAASGAVLFMRPAAPPNPDVAGTLGRSEEPPRRSLPHPSGPAEAVAVVDKNLVVVAANAAFREAFASEQCIGRRVLELDARQGSAQLHAMAEQARGSSQGNEPTASDGAGAEVIVGDWTFRARRLRARLPDSQHIVLTGRRRAGTSERQGGDGI